MAVRRDQVQLDVTFITDESRAFAKQIEANKQFVMDLRTAQKEGKGLDRVLGQIVDSAGDIEDIDLSNVAPRQLIDRARQIKRALDLIPQSAPQAARLRDQYKRINDQLAQVRQSTRGVVAGSKQMNSTFSALSTRLNAVLAAGAAVVGVFRGIGRAVSRASEFEQLNVALETFLGDADAARQVVQDLNEFSVRTPFEPEQVQRAGKALLAFGFDAETLIPTLTQIGDVAAGTGKDFNELVLILGKARAQGRVQGEELNQLAEAGIPIYEELGKVLNVNADQIRKLGEQGKIQFEDLQLVFQNLTSEGGRFNNLLEKQSQTLGGLFSTLRGAFAELSRNVGEAFAPLLKTVLPPLIELVNRLVERIRPLAAAVGQGLVRAFQFLARAVQPIISAFAELFSVFRRAAGESRLLNDVVQLLGAAFSLIANVIGTIITALARYLGGVQSAQDSTVNFSNVLAFVVRILTQIVAVLNGVVSAARVAFDQVGVLGTVIAENVGLAFDKIKGFFVDNEREIAARQARLANAYNQLGASLGDAFLKGYNDALGNGLEAPTTVGDGAAASGGGATAGALATRSIEQTTQELRKKLDARLKEIEADFGRQEVLLERSLLNRELTESEYGRRLLELKARQYQAQLDAFGQFNESQSVAAEQARNELIRVQQTLTRNPRTTETLAARGGGGVERDSVSATVDLVNQGRDNALERLREKFRAALIAEQDYELRRLELKRDALATEIALLRSGNEEQQRLAREKNEELLAIDEQLVDKRLENRMREQELQKQIQQAGLSATQDFFEITADLLAQDEAARKQNAKAIAAFERGRVIVAGVQEVQRIWSEAATLGPIAGPIVGGVQSALAIARTALALSKIDGAKFARGGMAKFGFFGGRPHSQGGTRGYFDDGTAIEVEKDEAFAIVNKRSSGVLRALSTLNQAGGGVPFFAAGGIPNTTPSTRAQAAVSPANAMPDIGALLGEVRALRTAFAEYPTRLRADVVYTDIESVGAELSTVPFSKTSQESRCRQRPGTLYSL